MDYAYNSDLVEEDKKKNELEETAFKTISMVFSLLNSRALT